MVETVDEPPGPSACCMDTFIAFAKAGNVEEVAQMMQEWQAEDEGSLPIAQVANTPGTKGSVAVCSAARKGHIEIVRMLLDVGIDPQVRDAGGYTALARATRAGHVDIMTLLLDRLQELHRRPKFITTLACVAARLGDMSAVSLLLERTEDMDNDELVASNQKSCSPLYTAVLNGHKEVVSVLLGAGSHPLAMAGCNRAESLHVCAERGYTDMLTLLLESNIDPNVKNMWGHTPLMLATMSKQTGIVAILTSQPGIHLNHVDDVGESALFHAVSNNDRASAMFLLNAGANPAIKNAQGLNCFHAPGLDLAIMGDVLTAVYQSCRQSGTALPDTVANVDEGGDAVVRSVAARCFMGRVGRTGGSMF